MANTLNLGDGQWATKEGSLLGYNSENNNYKPLPFTFDRASSATRVNKDGLIETVGADQPRVDYLNDSKGALLLEPQKSNISTRSNELNLWGSKVGVSITPNYSLSPDGSINSNRLLFSANGYCHNNNLQINGTVYTISAYVKRNTGTQNVGFFVNGSGAINYAFDLTNEWQRFEYTYTSVNTSTFGFAGISGADISVYGFQLEQGSYATSYIPTQGSAVTRLADSCEQTPPSGIIGQTEGTVFIEIDNRLLSPYPNEYVFRLAGTGGNELWLRKESGGNNFTARLVVDSSNIWTIGVTPPNGLTKIGLAYKSVDSVVYLNGTQVNTSSAAFSGNVLEHFYFGSSSSGNTELKVNQTKLYNTRLSNSELAALTQV